MTRPTEEYGSFDRAYDYFNDALFGGDLPHCMITLQRKRFAGGYFWPNKFIARSGEGSTDEIALNPDSFGDFDDRFILSILVHEMAHLWQQHFGKPSRNGYHNQQWAAKMCEIGLLPVSFDNPGKQTGQKVSHEIVPFGAFDDACTLLLDGGFALHWQSKPAQDAVRGGGGSSDDEAKAKAKRSSKTKYTCPQCSANAWAKPDSNLVCGDCMQIMEAQV